MLALCCTCHQGHAVLYHANVASRPRKLALHLKVLVAVFLAAFTAWLVLLDKADPGWPRTSSTLQGGGRRDDVPERYREWYGTTQDYKETHKGGPGTTFRGDWFAFPRTFIGRCRHDGRISFACKEMRAARRGPFLDLTKDAVRGSISIE